MTLSFSGDRLSKIQKEVIGWQLYQVEIDKYHVMFWFENGHCLLNVAHRFSFQSADNAVAYTYDVQAHGDRKSLNIDSILRGSVREIIAADPQKLDLIFESGDILSVHNDSKYRSAWFYRYQPQDHNASALWFVDDEFGEEDA